MFTCKSWEWEQISIDKNQYDKLLKYPTTISENNVKDIEVYQLFINGEKHNCFHVRWVLKGSLPNLELFFTSDNYNNIVA